MSFCSVPGCEGKVESWGLCNKHYLRLRKNGDVGEGLNSHAPMEERFWRRVQKGDSADCWPWLGSKRPNGYGMIHTGGRGGKYVSTHRYACELHHGPAPFERAVVMHSCDNPSCVNPHHLRWGTASENIKEAFTKLRKVAPRQIGEDHPQARLNADQVRFMRANASMGAAKLARVCSTSKTSVRAVLEGRTWKHIL
jgi:hypothetical protein